MTAAASKFHKIRSAYAVWSGVMAPKPSETSVRLIQLSPSCAESVVASICLGSTRTGVRQPKPDTVSKKPQSCSWSRIPRSPHARAGHNHLFRKLSHLTYPQAPRARKQGILGSVRMFDGPYLNLNIRPQPFFYSRKNSQPSAASHLPENPDPALARARTRGKGSRRGLSEAQSLIGS
jgi:hypothetical protein